MLEKAKAAQNLHNIYVRVFFWANHAGCDEYDYGVNRSVSMNQQFIVGRIATGPKIGSGFRQSRNSGQAE